MGGGHTNKDPKDRSAPVQNNTLSVDLLPMASACTVKFTRL